MNTETTSDEQPTQDEQPTPETIEFLTWFAESPSELKRLEQLVEQIRSNPGLMPSPPKKASAASRLPRMKAPRKARI